MRSYHQTSVLLVTAACVLACRLLTACGRPALRDGQADQQLGSFMLDYIVRQQIGGTASYIATSGQPWADAPPDANIIVWAPPADKIPNDSLDYLRTDEPLHVWWFAGNQLVEVTDKQEAIQAFRQFHFSSSTPNHGWGYYEFGILSLSNGDRDAKVYVGVSCGPLCGNGTIYSLHRSDDRTWAITGSEMRWIS